jgi:hypothetical protein
MGYRALLITVFRAAGLVRGYAPRQAWIMALVFCFAAASVLSAMAPAFAAAPAAAAVSHDHHGHGDAHAQHKAPCDHGQDCDCHGKTAAAHCCSSSAPAAAIWATAEPLPSVETARCVHGTGKVAVRAGVDPPTPPPRSVLS